MDIDVSYDPDDDVWTLIGIDAVIRTHEHLEQWRDLIDERTKLFGGKRVDLMVDMTGFQVTPTLAAEYGMKAKAVADEHTLCLIRYGSKRDPSIRTTVRLQGIVQGYDPNVVSDREAALNRLTEIRAER